MKIDDTNLGVACDPQIQSSAAWVLDPKDSRQQWGSVGVHTSTHRLTHVLDLVHTTSSS